MLLSKGRDFEALMTKIVNAKAKMVDVERRQAIASLSAKVLGRNGFLGTIFDEILYDIQHRCNEMIAFLPNASQFAISISSDKVTKTKGTAKKEIAVNITKDGKDVSIRSLSGGQQCSLELCADLASAEAIKSRSGSLFNWICLDEAMDGLGSEEKQAALDMLKQRASGLILIIDHSSEVKEIFTKVIEIEYDGRESRVI
jgi:DNA repair exonuclease SbcCD ATPase subunit